jgi:hypothetical protein
MTEPQQRMARLVTEQPTDRLMALADMLVAHASDDASIVLDAVLAELQDRMDGPAFVSFCEVLS